MRTFERRIYAGTIKSVNVLEMFDNLVIKRRRKKKEIFEYSENESSKHHKFDRPIKIIRDYVFLFSIQKEYYNEILINC